MCRILRIEYDNCGCQDQVMLDCAKGTGWRGPKMRPEVLDLCNDYQVLVRYIFASTCRDCLVLKWDTRKHEAGQNLQRLETNIDQASQLEDNARLKQTDPIRHIHDRKEWEKQTRAEVARVKKAVHDIDESYDNLLANQKFAMKHAEALYLTHITKKLDAFKLKDVLEMESPGRKPKTLLKITRKPLPELLTETGSGSTNGGVMGPPAVTPGKHVQVTDEPDEPPEVSEEVEAELKRLLAAAIAEIAERKEGDAVRLGDPGHEHGSQTIDDEEAGHDA